MHMPFMHHHHWVSPFDHGRLAEFYSAPKREEIKATRGLGEVIPTESGDFRWKCDVSGYLPEELKVDMEEKLLIVTGEHKESRDDEDVYRFLRRRVKMPAWVRKEGVRCHIDHHGHLMIEADAEPPNIPGIEVVTDDRIAVPFQHFAAM
ncbi:small HSP21-like protein [Aphelenchoides avenae]|nr:small HSP21-like protein [Aphelenchus avenae]